MQTARDLADSRPHALIRTADLVENGTTMRTIRSAVRDGFLVRIYRGAYMNRAQWEASSPEEKYRHFVRAVVGASTRPMVLSHYSAAVLHKLPIVTSWPPRVHVLTPEATGGSVKTSVYSHAQPTDPRLVEIDGLVATSLTRTVVDLACVSAFVDAVSVVDAALRLGSTSEDPSRVGTSREALLGELDRLMPRPGSTRARKAIEFGDARSESVGESLSRARMHELGFVAPDLQKCFRTAHGAYTVDFRWPSAGIIGEFDGRAKYFRDDLTSGLAPDDVLWREKRREDAIRGASGDRFVRWTWADAIDRQTFARLLGAGGVPR